MNQLAPRKRRKVRTSSNSKFIEIKAIKETQIEARDYEIDRNESSTIIDSDSTSDCIEIQESLNN